MRGRREIMNRIKLFTIGFTKKSAKAFFTALSGAGVKRVIDIRLNNVSQLSGFAKKDDLQYFLKSLCNIDYMHVPELAPTKEIMDAYRRKKQGWSVYEKKFLALISKRRAEKIISRNLLDGACLLCSEDVAEHCHRRLVAEYLNEKLGSIEVIHIV
jgi:uncharacterized protein (DUF488 family)